MNSSFQSEQLFDTFLTIQELSQSNVDEARKVFLIFYEKGVLKIAALMIINGMAPMSIPMLG